MSSKRGIVKEKENRKRDVSFVRTRKEGENLEGRQREERKRKRRGVGEVAQKKRATDACSLSPRIVRHSLYYFSFSFFGLVRSFFLWGERGGEGCWFALLLSFIYLLYLIVPFPNFTLQIPLLTLTKVDAVVIHLANLLQIVYKEHGVSSQISSTRDNVTFAK